MIQTATDFLSHAYTTVFATLDRLVVPAIFFFMLALVLHRRQGLTYFQKRVPQMALNIKIVLFNVLFVVPFLFFLGALIAKAVEILGIAIVPETVWAEMPVWLVILIAVIIGDFTGYWRHRLQHVSALWPAHSIHHSDTDMTWMTVERFHPVDRLSTYIIDNTILMLLGMPPFAFFANNFVRHYYGAFVHADLPWTYGPLRFVLVSPAMHQWHHANNPKAYNSNFAGVFSIWDQIFGTFYLPGRCNVPLGVSDKIEKTLVGQLTYPFESRAYRSHTQKHPANLTKEASPAHPATQSIDRK
jgi:sterol desaturase/sphingolipid hydroxylase (fatty acid hydroxylase superfamily)